LHFTLPAGAKKASCSGITNGALFSPAQTPYHPGKPDRYSGINSEGSVPPSAPAGTNTRTGI